MQACVKCCCKDWGTNELQTVRPSAARIYLCPNSASELNTDPLHQRRAHATCVLRAHVGSLQSIPRKAPRGSKFSVDHDAQAPKVWDARTFLFTLHGRLNGRYCEGRSRRFHLKISSFPGNHMTKTFNRRPRNMDFWVLTEQTGGWSDRRDLQI